MRPPNRSRDNENALLEDSEFEQDNGDLLADENVFCFNDGVKEIASSANGVITLLGTRVGICEVLFEGSSEGDDVGCVDKEVIGI